MGRPILYRIVEGTVYTYHPGLLADKIPPRPSATPQEGNCTLIGWEVWNILVVKLFSIMY